MIPLGPPSPLAHPFRLSPSEEEAPLAAEMQNNKPTASLRISFSCLATNTDRNNSPKRKKKKMEKTQRIHPTSPASHAPPYIRLAGRLLVPAVGPGPAFGAMLQLLAGGRQVHKESGGGGRLRGGERAARRLSILCGGRACRRRGGAE